MTAARPAAGEWTLWVVAISCALHATEEYFSGWQTWAHETLGIVMPTPLFVIANAALVILAVVLARIGWRRSAASLIVPAATLMNAILFHILPTLLQRRITPGLVTAVLLYVPFSTWAYVAAWRDGVPRRALLGAFAGGTLMMLSIVAAARYLVTAAA